MTVAGEAGGQFRQPDVETTAPPLSPLFPGLVLLAGGCTPACGGALYTPGSAAGGGAMQRARSLPGGSPSRAVDAACRPGRLMHFDSVGLVRLS